MSHWQTPMSDDQYKNNFNDIFKKKNEEVKDNKTNEGKDKEND